MEAVETIRSIAIVVLAVAAAALCLAFTVVLVVLLPRILRIASDLEKTADSVAQSAANTSVISRNFSERSGEIAENVAGTTDNLKTATASTAEAARNAAEISRSFAERSGEIAENVAGSVENLNAATASTAEAAGNLASASRILGPAGAVGNFVRASQGQLSSIFGGVRAVLGRENSDSDIKKGFIRKHASWLRPRD